MPQHINDDFPNVATEAELLEFANVVREAGGGEVIPALLPAIPGAPSSCLIARALNFECVVDGSTHIQGRWDMFVSSAELAERIAEAIDTVVYEEDEGSYIILPDYIGKAAEAFDRGLAFTDYREKFNA